MKSISILIALLVLSLGAVADLKPIQGTWKGSSGSMAGSPLPKAMLDKMILKIKGGSYDYNEGHGDDIGILKEIGAKAPLGLDIVGTKGPNRGRTLHARSTNSTAPRS